MNKIIIGIIGAGRIGKLHISNIIKHIPQFHIKAIADPYVDDSWANSQSIPHLFKDANEIFIDPEITAVLICSPSTSHANHIISAAQAGKHIFCEKPISTNIKQIQEALHAVKISNVKLQVGFNRRFDPNFAKIKKMLSNDNIGTPQLLRITSRDPKIPSIEYLKESGGMFIDTTIHDFDMARFLMNSEIEEIYANANALIHPSVSECDDIDTAIINLKFVNNFVGKK